LLQEREQQATSLAASLPGAIFTHILLPDGRDKIEFMSSGSHRLWEISPQDAVGDPALLWGQVVPEDVNALAESIKRSAETGEDWNAQWSDPDTFRPIQVS